MTNNLDNLLSSRESTRHAVAHGNEIHHKLQFVFVDGNNTRGDTELVAQITAHPELHRFFTPQSQTELPIAGIISGRFISRRIDRIVINHTTKLIEILDYKTDITPCILCEKYKNQIGEYITLLSQIYPEYTIGGFILWLHDWTLEKIY